MQRLREILEEISKGIAENVYRQAVTRDELVKMVVDSGIYSTRDDALILLDEEICTIRKPSPVGQFTVQYNHYKECLTFERAFSMERMERTIETTRITTEERLRRRIRELKSKAFEVLLLDLYSNLRDYHDIRIGGSGSDEGIDFKGTHISEEGEVLVFGQAKLWKQKVSAPVIRDFIGAIKLAAGDHESKGIFICMGGFSIDALKVVERSTIPLEAVDGDRLISLLLKSDVGVKRMESSMQTIDEGYWDDIDIYNY